MEEVVSRRPDDVHREAESQFCTAAPNLHDRLAQVLCDSGPPQFELSREQQQQQQLTTSCHTGRRREERGAEVSAALFCHCAAGKSAGMSQKERPTFYRQELNKTVWEVPERYQHLSPVGSGAYGSVW